MTEKINVNSPSFIVELVKYFGETHIQNLEETYQNCEYHMEVTNPYDPNNCVGCNIASYYSLYHNKQNTSYHCQQENFIYAVRTMPCHAEEICTAFVEIKDEENYYCVEFLKSKNKLNMTSIGFGCGTDLLAMLQILNFIELLDFQNNHSLSEYNQIQQLNVLRIDDQAENWQQSADAVEDFIRNRGYIKDNFDFSVTENESNFIGNTDIFIMSYVYNELNSEEKEKIYQKISELASEHFLLIINDYDGAGHRYFTDPLFGGFDYKKFGLEKLHSRGCSWNKMATSFKNQMKVWHYPHLNLTFQQRYAMKVNMNSICYAFEFKRIDE